MGAAANRIFNLARAINKNGHNALVISALPNYPMGNIFKEYQGKLKVRENYKGIETIRVFIFPTLSSNIIKRLLSMFSFNLGILSTILHIIRYHPTHIIIQGHPLISSGFVMMLAKLLRISKRILYVSDLWPNTGIELGIIQNSFLIKYLKHIELYLYRNVYLIVGQSQSILNYIIELGYTNSYLFRNVPPETIEFDQPKTKQRPFKIIYAGLIGYAQGLLELCRNVDFQLIEAELHIFGDGAEKDELAALIRSGCKSIHLHNSLPRDELAQRYGEFDLGLVPLKKAILGAVPSKIFELIGHGLPVFYIGHGEAREIIRENNLGFEVASGDYKKIHDQLLVFKNLNHDEYLELKKHCRKVFNNKYNYNKYIEGLLSKI